jgi:hypothetical protein
MLAVLEGFHGRPIQLPARKANHPDRKRLALRYEGFE